MKIDTNRVEWDYSRLLNGDLDEQIESEKKAMLEFIDSFVSKWRDNNDYLEKPEVLKEALDEMEKFHASVGFESNAVHYLWLENQKDQTNEDVKARLSLLEDFLSEQSNRITFFGLSISKIPKDKQDSFIEFEGLKKYKHFLEKTFRDSKYILSEEAENILSLKSGPSYRAWVNMTSELLSKEEREVFMGEKKVMKNFSEIRALLDSTDKKVRDSAADALNDILECYADVATNEVNAILKDKKINDDLRGFSRVDESRIVGDDIDNEFVDSLISAVTKRFDISRRYYELKAKLFGFDKLGYHERGVPYGNVTRKVPYGEAVEIVYDSFNALDLEFGELFKSFVEEGNIDVYPGKGKRSGAFCSWALKIHPTRILLNYMDRPYDVMVLAHESGHGINHEMIKKCNSLDFGVTMAVAEVASTFGESIVFDNLLSKIEDEEERLAFMVTKVGDDLASVSRQVACYCFEKDLHKEFRKKGRLSREDIGEIFSRNMKAYMGDFVEHDEKSSNWWIHWPHIREFFYVYSYSSGVLISNSMVAKYKEDPKFILKVKEFLSFGKSKSPRDSFKEIGIDLNEEFWNKGLDNIENRLKEAWGLAEKLGKL